jgi:predicted secreted protein
MAKVKGLDVYVEVNTGTHAVPVWTKVGGQKKAKMSWKHESVDVTDKDSAGFKEKLTGLREVSVDFDAFLIESDAGFAQLKTGMIGTSISLVEARLRTPGHYYAGYWALDGLDLEGDVKDASPISFKMTSSGAIAES